MMIDLRVEDDLDAGHAGAVVSGDAVEAEVGEGERRLVEAGVRGRPPAPAGCPAAAAAAAAAMTARAAAAPVTVGGLVAPVLAAADDGDKRTQSAGWKKALKMWMKSRRQRWIMLLCLGRTPFITLAPRGIPNFANTQS